MHRAGGYLLVTGPGGTAEADTFTCCHCQQVVIVPPKAAPADAGGWCWRCSKPICSSCAASGECTPFEKRLERLEASARLRAAITGSN